MKKILVLILSLALITAFCACGTEEAVTADTSAVTDDAVGITAEVTETDAPEETSPAEDEIYVITLDNGTVIPVGSTDEEAVTALGTPVEVLEASSCIHEGYDRVYTFDGFSITTSPDGKGNQYIAEFTMLSDLVAFENGLTVGSPADALTAVFGEDYKEQFGVLTYTLDSVTVSAVIDDAAVSGITVSANK